MDRCLTETWTPGPSAAIAPAQCSAVDLPVLDLTRPASAHLIGADGSGMTSLAAVLAQADWQCTESDARRAEISEPLRPDLDLVIFSDAIPAEHAERRHAERLGIPAISYPAALGQLMSQRRGLAVAGTHGKSTTAAMLAEILECAAADPTYVFGAVRQNGRSGGRLGHGDWMIAEACEYRANFRFLRPEVAVLLGIEPDHFDYYRGLADIDEAFRQFVAGVPDDSSLIVRHDCALTESVARDRSIHCESFGLSPAADWHAAISGMSRGCCRFSIRHCGVLLGEVQLAVPARHNVLNALAAAAAAHRAGANWRAIRAGLEAFSGLRRRLEIVLDGPQLAVVDDFAHLPTEISAGLAALGDRYPGRRRWCVFQPHQVSRTANLLDELAASLQNADRIVVADIFRAREGPAAPGEVTARDLAARAAALGANVVAAHGGGEISTHLEQGLQAGDVLVTMGAGDIGNIAHGIAQRFRKNHTPG